MAESLRIRLLTWHAGMVMLVLALVAVAVCWVTWRSRLSAIDEELRARAASVSAAVRPSGGGFDVELPAEATTYFQRPITRPYYAVWRADGGLVDRSDPDAAPETMPGVGVRTRGSSREVVIRTRGLTILTGRDIGAVWRELWALAVTMAAVGCAGAAAALAGGWLLAGRALAPVQRINTAARQMAGGDLRARIAVSGTETELGQVAAALNLAFDRLRDSLERQRRLTADASHELRTPVATINAELEWALRRDRSGDEYRDSLETCRRAGARMQSLIENLLTLARAEGGDLPLQRVDVSLDEVARQAAGLLRPVADRRNVAIALEPVAPSELTDLRTSGDPDRLHDLISTVLFNAIVYNRPGGRVTIAVRRAAPRIVLRIQDTGIGIASEELPRIFDRFYRSPAARAMEPAGAGLGLALARWIVEAHGGAIACTSDPGRGTEIVIELPAAHAAAVDAAGRRSARFASPPATPAARTSSVSAGVQIEARPSAASSE